jgi:hypothetical protein
MLDDVMESVPNAEKVLRVSRSPILSICKLSKVYPMAFSTAI